MMVIDMKVIIEMLKEKENEFFIIVLMRIIDMKVNGEMIKKNGKEFIIGIMVIYMKVIG